MATTSANPAAGSQPYTTTARVLLSGLGADELFGGYGRHAAAFERAGYAGLAEELLLDISRIGRRNLGRDDRVMSHWGREVRFPFLDEDLVRWAISLPVPEKCDFANAAEATVDNGNGRHGLEPGKRVLRLLAAELGMQGVAREKKRAVSQDMHFNSSVVACVPGVLIESHPLRSNSVRGRPRCSQANLWVLRLLLRNNHLSEVCMYGHAS